MRIYFWIATLILLVGLIGAGVWLSTSLLFFRTIAPANGVIIGSESGTVLEPFMRRVLAGYVPSQTQEAVTGFSRWLYSRTGNESDSITGITNNEGVVTLPDWQTRQLGWVTIQSESGPMQSTQTTILNALKLIGDAALNHTVFIQPTVYAEFPAEPGPLYISGKLKSDIFSFVYSRVDADSLPMAIHKSQYADVSKLEVAIQSHYIASLPPTTKQAIQSLLVAKLGLTKTNPAVLEQLLQYHTVGMLDGGTGEQSSADAFAVGSLGSDLAVVAQEWVALERAYLNPVEHAFRLPDGTIGYELVPAGDATADFGEANEEGCRQSTISAGQAWLCQRGEVVTFGRTYDATRELMIVLAGGDTAQNPDNDGNAFSWHAVLPGSYINSLPASFGIPDQINFKGMYVEGSANNGRGYLVTQ